jgi:hypothetical protein
MDYNGQSGGWIPMEYIIEYLTLQEKHPLALDKIEILENSNKDLSTQFDALEMEYQILRKRQAILIGVTVGACFLSVSVVSGVIAGIAIATNTS